MPTKKKLSIEEVKKVARLANLEISDDEADLYAVQLAEVIILINRLREVNTVNIVPTSQVTGQKNVFRDDEVDMSRVLTQDQALGNVSEDRRYNGYFVVPNVFGT